MVKKSKKTLVISIIIMFLIQIIGFNPQAAYAGTGASTVDMYIGWQGDEGAVYLDQTTKPMTDGNGTIASYVGNYTSIDLKEEGAALKFNLSSVRGNITSATLKINVSEIYGNPILNIIKITDDSWNTNTLYKPSYNEKDIINGYTNYNITSTGIKSFNVTTYLQDEQKNNNIASFALTGSDNGDNDFAFICDPASPLKPALEITYAPYNVTFDSQGGNQVTAIVADYNTTIAKPSAPSKLNYTFGGWYKEAACTNQWNFTTDKIANNTTLYAKWNPVSYNVTFDSQGGSAVRGISADYNNTISVVTPPTREGYTFEGWYKEVACINPWNFITDKVTANTTLYARWTINKYTINFDSQGGSQVSSQTVEYNSLITTQSVPTKAGCTFKGWYKEAAFINEWNFNADKITRNTTLYSKWRINADINQDGGVDITDLAEIAKNYNDKSGQINWKADCDLNKDGIIDIYDLVFVSRSIKLQ